MSRERVLLGEFGERVAVAHLESEGYRVLARNFRCREGEIDIIAQNGGCLVFVEVRTRRGESMGSAAESLTPLKGARISAAAEAYCDANPDCGEECRIDVIAVDLTPRGRLLRLEHIENAFSSDELPDLSGG
jgi:putative endonuclease